MHFWMRPGAGGGDYDWKQTRVPEEQRAAAMMKNAMAYTKSCIAEIRSIMKNNNLDIPILIGEAGWKSKTHVPTGAKAEDERYEENYTEQYFASPVNQKIFYDNLINWVYGDGKDANSPKAAFYFEAFDEPWKDDDDNWGLFNVNRKAKYVIWSLFPELKDTAQKNYSEKDAVYFK